jgi:hypothetical protein
VISIVKNASLLLVFALIASSMPCGAATSISNFTAAENDRFANSSSFIASGSDFSGVGRSTDGRWVTMISSNVFISATHYHPADGSSVTFHPGNSAAAPVTRVISGSQQIGTTDLWVGFLDSSVGPSIKFYNRVTGSFSASDLSGASVFMSGLSPTTTGYGTSNLTNQTVGTNRVELFQANQAVDSETGDAIFTIENQGSGSDFGYTNTPYEAQLAVGDSGAPLFQRSGTDLILAGMNWATGVVDIDSSAAVANRNVSVYSYVGTSNAIIDSYVASHPVPEPSALYSLLLGIGLVMRRKRMVGV